MSHVLVVDDDFLVLDVMAQLCTSQGMQVFEASDGEAALTILRKHGPAIDWLFTDLHLPGLISGLDVAEAFRTMHSDGPVVYTSACDRLPQRAVRGSLYLRKPFHIREVSAAVRVMCQGNSDEPSRLTA